jgi:phage terminase large subunit GpA-like protein
VDPKGLAGRLERYPAGSLPPGADVITAGVDIQENRIEMEAVAWCRDTEESWSLDYWILRGDTAQPDVWLSLSEALADSGAALAAIDAGYQTQMVVDFCNAHLRNAVAIKGVTGAGRPLVEDIKRRKARLKNRKKGAALIEPLGVDQAKTLIYSRLKQTKPGPGYMHYPAREVYDDEYFAQLTSEKLVPRDVQGRPKLVWVQTRKRNEALDCRIYALAALRLMATAARRPRRVAVATPETPPPAPTPNLALPAAPPRTRGVRSRGV